MYKRQENTQTYRHRETDDGKTDAEHDAHTERYQSLTTDIVVELKAADTGQNFWLVFGLAVLVFCVVQVITCLLYTSLSQHSYSTSP